MRPPGEISKAVRDAWQRATQAASAPVAATSRDVVTWLVPRGVGRRAVLNTVKNLARAGHLKPVGTQRVPGVCKPLTLYCPAWGDAPAADPAADLAATMRAWHR
jgi:hypothetical protein